MKAEQYPGVPAEKPQDWSERLVEYATSFRNAVSAFKLLWEVAPGRTFCLGLITLFSSIIPVIQAWVAKRIIDGAVHVLNSRLDPHEGLRQILPFILLEFILITIGSILFQARAMMEIFIDNHLGYMINTRIIRKALGLEVKHFENSEFYDMMQKARQQAEGRVLAVVRGGFSFCQNVITLGSFLSILLAFNIWLGVLLCFATVPIFIVQSHFSNYRFRLWNKRTPEKRGLDYIERLLTSGLAVMEIKLFSLGESLLGRRKELFYRLHDEDFRLARSRSLGVMFWGLVSQGSYYGAYIWILYHTFMGFSTLGGMTMYLSILRQSQTLFQGALASVNTLYENGLFLGNLFSFLGLESSMVVWDAKDRPREDPVRGIDFEGVWFKYPENEDWALEDFTLSIGPNEKLAIVGENGAGKSTLIKLLSRLYDPTRGRILFHGVDLRYFPPEELHRRIGALFQDFVKYQFTLRENVGFGAVDHLNDEARILAASRMGGADEIAKLLPEGYDSNLGRTYQKGFELSGGQWQKIALSRAFMKDAEVLVLDEPSSALDALAESQIFERFKDLTNNRLAILVSHRFSTVRIADRIVVVSGGRIKELGSHDELIRQGGMYARLFDLQAQGYR